MPNTSYKNPTPVSFMIEHLGSTILSCLVIYTLMDANKGLNYEAISHLTLIQSGKFSTNLLDVHQYAAQSA